MYALLVPSPSRTSSHRVPAVVAAAALLLGACAQGGDTEVAVATTTTSPATSPTTSVVPTSSTAAPAPTPAPPTTALERPVDAVAGVVNFVLRKDFEGVQLDANYNFYNHNNKDTIVSPLARAAGFGSPRGLTNDGGRADVTLTAGTKLLDGKLRLAGGVRYEKVTLKVADFTTLAFYGSREVDGGKPSFDKALVNGGVIVEPIDGLRACLTIPRAARLDTGEAVSRLSGSKAAAPPRIPLRALARRSWGISEPASDHGRYRP